MLRQNANESAFALKNIGSFHMLYESNSCAKDEWARGVKNT
jgi:hypothetical protein